jgi:hypothetical protein
VKLLDEAADAQAVADADFTPMAILARGQVLHQRCVEFDFDLHEVSHHRDDSV